MLEITKEKQYNNKTNKIVTIIVSIMISAILTTAAFADGLLPSKQELFGVAMPSAAKMLERSPDDEKIQSDGRLYQRFNYVNEDQYTILGEGFAAGGCSLSKCSGKGNVISILLEKDKESVEITYDVKNKISEIQYSEMVYIAEDLNIKGKGSIFPTVDDILGVIMPAISDAINKTADNETRNESGNLVQFYNNFDDKDYSMFSSFLSQSGCEVSSYTSEGNTINITLTRESGSLYFTYDRKNGTARAEYGDHSRIEYPDKKAPVSTSLGRYSEETCEITAINYLKSTLKNPDSLQINSIGCSSSTNYIFTIDFSAMNGFGGYNRKTTMIRVDPYTNTVVN